MKYTAGVAAATAIVGYNLLRDERWARTPVDRMLNGFGLTGSAVIGDSEVEVFVDEQRVGSYFNDSLLLGSLDNLGPLEVEVPAGAELTAIVRDAPATSILYATLDLEDVE